ncbi:MAG: trans-sulfuration enzyme family protein [Gemmobacter sp.]
MTDRPDPLRPPFDAGRSRALVSPILPSVVWVAESPDDLDRLYSEPGSGFTYAREGHPNAAALAARLDAMDGAAGGVVTGSGMAAVTLALMACVGSGDHVLGGDQLYGRSLRLMRSTLPALGIATSLADPTDAAAFGRELRPETRAILIETVSNPTLRVADLAGIAALARERGIRLLVDATFSTPRAIRVLDHGADVVVHSVTKLLAGHSDVTLGYAGTRDPGLLERMRDLAATFGLSPSPFDCWLAERGLLTFALRHDRAEATAARLADALAAMPAVRRVLYPARPDHPDHNRAVGLLSGRGGNMLSFEIEGGRAAANALTRAMAGVAFAPTLGDVATTLSHAASSSHREVPEAQRRAIGISEGFFRVSVGLEEPDALIGQFRAGLGAAAAVTAQSR